MHDYDRHLSDRDLLLAIDRELPSRRQAGADRHLAACDDCRARCARFERVAGMATAFCRIEAAGGGDQAEARERLRSALSATPLEARDPRRVWLPPAPAGWRGRVLAGAAAIAALMVLVRVVAPVDPSRRAGEADALPVAALTPGATWNVTVEELCAGGGRQQRPLPPLVRHQVLRGYGMESVPADEYELDYLVTPELGGAPDAQNIWPQRYRSRTWNAHVKDQLEELLPRLVCEGRVPLRTAQRDIAADWILAYKRYFATEVPLPRSRRLPADAVVGTRDDDVITYPVWRSGNAPALELISFSASR